MTQVTDLSRLSDLTVAAAISYRNELRPGDDATRYRDAVERAFGSNLGLGEGEAAETRAQDFVARFGLESVLQSPTGVGIVALRDNATGERIVSADGTDFNGTDEEARRDLENDIDLALRGQASDQVRAVRDFVAGLPDDGARPVAVAHSLGGFNVVNAQMVAPETFGSIVTLGSPGQGGVFGRVPDYPAQVATTIVNYRTRLDIVGLPGRPVGKIFFLGDVLKDNGEPLTQNDNNAVIISHFMASYYAVIERIRAAWRERLGDDIALHAMLDHRPKVYSDYYAEVTIGGRQYKVKEDNKTFDLPGGITMSDAMAKIAAQAQA